MLRKPTVIEQNLIANSKMISKKIARLDVPVSIIIPTAEKATNTRLITTNTCPICLIVSYKLINLIDMLL